MKGFIGFALAAGLLFLAACRTTQPQAKAWELKPIYLAPGQAATELKKYAKDGWTLVGVVTNTPMSPTDDLREYILKRPIQ
jgi:hypothetical protein